MILKLCSKWFRLHTHSLSRRSRVFSILFLVCHRSTGYTMTHKTHKTLNTRRHLRWESLITRRTPHHAIPAILKCIWVCVWWPECVFVYTLCIGKLSSLNFAHKSERNKICINIPHPALASTLSSGYFALWIGWVFICCDAVAECDHRFHRPSPQRWRPLSHLRATHCIARPIVCLWWLCVWRDDGCSQWQQRRLPLLNWHSRGRYYIICLYRKLLSVLVFFSSFFFCFISSTSL